MTKLIGRQRTRYKCEMLAGRSHKQVLWELQSGRCFYCLTEFPLAEMTRDHIVPKMLKGKSRFDNYVVACRDCNSLKSGYEVHPDWVRERIEVFNFRDWNRVEAE